MIRLPLVLTVFVAVVGAGIVDGVWSDRWGHAADLDQAAARFDRIPLAVGDWEGKVVEDEELTTGLVGPIALRRYVNRSTGAAVNILLTCGRHGPLLVNHTPLDCYPMGGWTLVGQPARRTVSLGSEAENASFWVAGFDKTERAFPMHIRIYWAWSGDGHWQTPERPRLTFARFHVLYKLYVTRQLAKPDEPLEGDTAEEFMRSFLPQLQKECFQN
jgi:Protein of unknown function (DUF3485)